MEFLHQLMFAGDAELLAMIGTALIFAGLCANLMDRRRLRRSQIDSVGWVPWLGLFMACAVIGGGLLMVAIPSLMKG